MATFGNANISIGGDIKTLANIKALRNHLPRGLRDGDSVFVSGNQLPGDGKGGAYTWQEHSTAADDGQTVIKPVTSIASGRWVLMFGAGKDGKVLMVGLWTGIANLDIPVGLDLIQTSGYAVPGRGAARYALDTDQTSTAVSPFRRKSANGRWFKIAEDAIGYTMAGAVGDGRGQITPEGIYTPDSGTDDTAAIQSLYDYLAAKGGGTAIVEARQFNVRSLTIRANNIKTVGVGEGSHIHTITTGERLNVFNADGVFDNRLTGLVWDNVRISGGTRWGATPYDFNEVLTGNGIRTNNVDDVRVVNCTFDHLSDSGPSVTNGHRAVIQGNTIIHVAQGIDIFYTSLNGRIIGNTISDIKVFVGINVEGKEGVGIPRGTTIVGNTIDKAVTAGIDVIESLCVSVTGNTVTNISGNHAGFPGYSFGIHVYGSPKTVVTGNNVQGVGGNMQVDGQTVPCGVGIDIAAGSSDSMVASNSATSASLSALRINDTNGTSPTLLVQVGDNALDSEVMITGQTTTRPRTVVGRVPQLIFKALAATTRNTQIVFQSLMGSPARFGIDVSTNSGSRDFHFFYDDEGLVASVKPSGQVNAKSYAVNGSKVIGPQQAAIPDTNAATLVNLEAEVNKLKATLRAHGLIA